MHRHMECGLRRGGPDSRRGQAGRGRSSVLGAAPATSPRLTAGDWGEPHQSAQWSMCCGQTWDLSPCLTRAGAPTNLTPLTVGGSPARQPEDPDAHAAWLRQRSSPSGSRTHGLQPLGCWATGVQRPPPREQRGPSPRVGAWDTRAHRSCHSCPHPRVQVLSRGTGCASSGRAWP